MRRAGAVTAAVAAARMTSTMTLATRAFAAPAPARELSFMNLSRGMARALGVLATRYESQRGVKVNVDTTGPIDYPQKLLASAQTNAMPDVFFLPPDAAYAP